jgi:hypothetical protein
VGARGEFRAIVENAWRLSMNTGTGVVSDAVRGVASHLWDWSRNILGDLEKRIKHVKRELEACRRRALSSDVVARAQILWYKLEKLEEQRDMYWRQRRKVHWLQYGDQNMNFFHRYAFERRRRSRINKLVKEDGDAVTDVAGIHELVTEYYKSLFKSHAQVIDMMS